MRDGPLGALTLWLPKGDGPFPAILIRSLNRRQVTVDHLGIRSLLRAGFAVASADARGRFESEGELDPTYGPQEGRDTYDTLVWLAAQPWCTGAVATLGGSHQAFYQTSMAKVGAPAALKAMATWTGGYRDGRTENAGSPMSGGVVALGTTLIWLPNEAGGVLDRLAGDTGVDVEAAKRTLARMRSHPRETFEHLPLIEAPIAQYGNLRDLFAYRLARTSTPSDGVASPPGEVITTPVFHEAGWFDHACWTQIEAHRRLRDEAGTAAARAGQHIVLGPWPHGSVFADRLGDVYFGPDAGSAGSPLHELQVRFFQRYVTGADVDLPAVTYFVMGRNEWRTSEVWPPAGLTRRRLYLHSGGAARRPQGDGELSPDAPGDDEPADEYLYDPAHPVPTLGGALDWQLVIPGMIAGPVEQGPVERRPDVLCYTTAPLRAPVEISGPIVLNLFASTSAMDTDFTAKVCQVLPDGRSYNIQEGILRLSGRNLLGRRESVTPGEVYELRIGVGQTSIVVEAGSCLRLQVTSSNFPHWDRNMNTGNPVGTDTAGVVARQAVHHAGSRASYLELPMTELRE
jgi:putative CocE/NonD family hydrolase